MTTHRLADTIHTSAVHHGRSIHQVQLLAARLRADGLEMVIDRDPPGGPPDGGRPLERRLPIANTSGAE